MKDFKKLSGIQEISKESRRSFLKKTGSLIALASAAGPIESFAKSMLPSNIKTKGYAARSADGILSPYEFERRALNDDDVQIEILYSGVCHSDIHTLRGHWGPAHYPLTAGHEIAGRVIAAGKNVKKFKVGDHAGVGCMVDSCGSCPSCAGGHEQFCEGQATFTYDSPDKQLGGYTQGGYSKTIVVREAFAIKIPQSLDLKYAAPLLCAGITTYSPMIAWNIEKGMKIGVAGIGGLGHMAIKLAASKGAEVKAFTTSASKVEDIKRFGAKEVVVVDDMKALRGHRASVDYLISTVPFNYDINAYIGLVKRGGTFTQVGVPGEPYTVHAFALVGTGVKLNGSLIGGIPETQEVVDYCAANNIVPEVQLINMEDINGAHDKVVNKEVRYRYVIDMSKFI